MNYCTAKHDKPSSITASPLRAMHHPFLSKGPAFFPEKMRLELAEVLQLDRERWNLPKSGENCAQKTFRGHLDSERVKLTVICTAAIATLPRTSFPDNNFASCLFDLPQTELSRYMIISDRGREEQTTQDLLDRLTLNFRSWISFIPPTEWKRPMWIKCVSLNSSTSTPGAHAWFRRV